MWYGIELWNKPKTNVDFIEGIGIIEFRFCPGYLNKKTNQIEIKTKYDFKIQSKISNLCSQQTKLCVLCIIDRLLNDERPTRLNECADSNVQRKVYTNGVNGNNHPPVHFIYSMSHFHIKTIYFGVNRILFIFQVRTNLIDA